MLDNKSPIELLEIVKEALDLLVNNAALFGRGNEIDIIKANELINNITLD